ncbi:energy transducer TonB [Candidatus Nitronereus thalassa]|uniref:Energy transducer TonB n=1 Tax=Candidatus Nitronereus thalassa TaxID=3020898 RepID=A0ABU3K4V5_9BACT|nr:energy transducer TonB [Candidatus Nitronereus thalassa]MDT7041432.1 energy transducer TonB [Candidatus Nitronereus thalassa]
MTFHKKRSRYFGVFSSYSLVVHLAVFVAIFIFSTTPPPKVSSPTINVRLVDEPTSPPQNQAVPRVSNFQKVDHKASAEKTAIPPATPTPTLFQVLRPDLVSTSLPQKDGDRSRLSTQAFAPVAVNGLTPVRIIPTGTGFEHEPEITSHFSRTLLDHKARSSLLATTPAKILFKQPPPYPRVARELGLEGKTLLRVEVLQDGRPGSVKVRESCGHAVLDEAAAQAIKNWKFAPAQDGLFTVRSIVDLPIRFSLQS